MDEIEKITEPIYHESSGRLIQSPDEECASVAASDLIHGPVLGAARAPMPSLQHVAPPLLPFMRGGHMPWHDVVGRAVLYPAFVKGGVAYLMDPVPVKDGIVLPHKDWCPPRSEMDDRTVEEVLEMVRACEPAVPDRYQQEFKDKLAVGAICWPPYVVPECNLDSDCIGPATTCQAGACVPR